ncbi:MAG TPA: hypothetical protein VMV92_03390 [Streptosporangiaceae bacterium]|nr:hypothetical protein [Streptosporangiaceae bacterium]
MGSAPSDRADGDPLSVFKILVAGGFGAGKTTLVCDARQLNSVKNVLITLVEHVLASNSAGSSGPSRAAAAPLG